MGVSEGTIVYSQGSYPCSGVGLTWSSDELEAAIGDSVAAILLDDEGTDSIGSILSVLADTEFAQDELNRILSVPESVEDWRVGEAIAEAYLTEHRSCYFPWPDSRDERKSGSSLPGADLVGFCEDEKGSCLAFGEVKTSSEAQYPPGAMYGRTGLKQQLEDLRDSSLIRGDLLKYLGYRADQAPWRALYEGAGGRYLKNNSDVLLFGVLIRDVTADEGDLRARVRKLGQDCPDGTVLELLALYLPAGSIDGLGKVVLETRSGP